MTSRYFFVRNENFARREMIPWPSLWDHLQNHYGFQGGKRLITRNIYGTGSLLDIGHVFVLITNEQLTPRNIITKSS